MKKLQSQGYSLVELLVVMIVGTVIIGAAQGLIVSNGHLSQRTRDVAVVNAYAEKKIESIRSAGYSTLAVGALSLTAELPDELKSPRTSTLTVTQQSTSVKRLHLLVTYNDQGAQRTYQYTTFIGELGVGQ